MQPLRIQERCCFKTLLQPTFSSSPRVCPIHCFGHRTSWHFYDMVWNSFFGHSCTRFYCMSTNKVWVVVVICFLALHYTLSDKKSFVSFLGCPSVDQKQTSRDHHAGSLAGACVWHLGSDAIKQTFNSWTDVHTGAGSSSVLFVDTLFYWTEQI